MSADIPVTLLRGVRHFAWRPTALNGTERRVWLRFAHRLKPVYGFRPLNGVGREVRFTDRLPFCVANPLNDPVWTARMDAHLRSLKAHLVLWLAMTLLTAHAAGWAFGHPAAFGGWHLTSDVVLYPPWAPFEWHHAIRPTDRWVPDLAIVADVILLTACVLHALRPKPRPTAFGADRWADEDDIRRAGLVQQRPANDGTPARTGLRPKT